MTDFEIVLYKVCVGRVLQMTDPVARVGRECLAEAQFSNPVDQTLTNCTLTFSGSGLLKEEYHLS